MNRILNPFEYLSNGKAIAWGVAGTLLAVGLVLMTRWPIEYSVGGIFRIFSTNLLLWLPLSLLLYVAALVFSPSRIRAVDIFSTNLFALLPTILLVGVVNAITYWLSSFDVVPGSAGEVMVRAAYNLLVIILSVSMVWSMVWGCYAYNVSANMKDLRGVVIFVVCFVFVSVVIQLFNDYM